jgi:hypothetical protein
MDMDKTGDCKKLLKAMEMSMDVEAGTALEDALPQQDQLESLHHPL